MAPVREQYRLVQAIPLIPTGIAFCFSYFVPETPRFLIAKEQRDAGRAVLARLRGKSPSDRSIEKELSLIYSQVRKKASLAAWAAFKESQTNANFRQRFWLLMIMQTVAQWTGGNGITYYVPQIFGYAGLHSNSISLISSGAYGAVKFVFTIAFSWVLVDRVGRRLCSLTGLGLQLAAHIYMAIYLGLQPGWSHNENASNAAIASVFIYAVGWSVGLCTMPFLYGAEIFPMRIRTVCYACSNALHWFFQFAVVRVTPNMFASLDVWGAYCFWAAVCFYGLVILGVWMPETKGVPIERMGELFDGPWYLRWCAVVGQEHPATETSSSSSLDMSEESVDEKKPSAINTPYCIRA